jgi:acetyl esterase/lipase
MGTRHLIDPELAPVLDLFPAFQLTKENLPEARALTAERLAGLPPTYVCVGALDLFVEENLEYARRLMRAGVPTELHLYPGACHGFNLAAGARVSRAYARDCLGALRRALHHDGHPAAGTPGA